jgi:hypothetical protein
VNGPQRGAIGPDIPECDFGDVSICVVVAQMGRSTEIRRLWKASKKIVKRARCARQFSELLVLDKVWKRGKVL